MCARIWATKLLYVRIFTEQLSLRTKASDELVGSLLNLCILPHLLNEVLFYWGPYHLRKHHKMTL